MNGRQKATQINSSSHRTYLQYMLETIWTAGAGVVVTSLATLSERVEGHPSGAPRFDFKVFCSVAGVHSVV
jgi:hypothetical protein